MKACWTTGTCRVGSVSGVKWGSIFVLMCCCYVATMMLMMKIECNQVHFKDKIPVFVVVSAVALVEGHSGS